MAHVNFNLHDNDKKLIEYGKSVTMDVMHAAGAVEVVQEARYAHLVGGARMDRDRAANVLNAFGRTHDIANLFVCDGSVLPTKGSSNPGLTIEALAARTADYLISQGAAVFHSAPVSCRRIHRRSTACLPRTPSTANRPRGAWKNKSCIGSTCVRRRRTGSILRPSTRESLPEKP